MANQKPAQTGLSRAFIIENGAGPDNVPNYEGFMRAGALSQSFGDTTKIEVPSADQWDQFDEVGVVKGAVERATSSLIGRYALDAESKLFRLAKKGCPSDVQINFGDCTNPSAFNEFKKKLIEETITFTSYETDELGALGSDERAVVNETSEYSIKTAYEVLRLNFASRAGDLLTNEVIDIVVCDQISCGDCDDPSDGCQKAFALTKAAGGSPSTPADVVYTLDGGATWYAIDIDTLGAAEEPAGIACVGDYIVVVSNDSSSLHYALKSEFTKPPTSVTWTEVSTGFVTGGEPNDIWSVGNTAFVVGDAGYIYLLTDPTAGVTVLDAGVAQTDDYRAVHAIDDEIAVAVGDAGIITKTVNQSSWAAVTSPVGVGVVLNCVWLQTKDLWFVGTNGGQVYYTKDAGTTWTEKTFTGSGAGQVRDIQFPTASVGYIAHDNATPRGRLLRTYDGGRSWVVLPESTGNLPVSDRLTAIATCKSDVNKVFAGGLADDGADGFLLVGED